MGAMEKSTFTLEYALLREQLVQIRNKAGLSQRELAKRLDVPHSWVAKVETGERRIDFVEFCLLIAACDCDPLSEAKKLTRQFASIATKRAGKGGRSK